MPVVLVLVLGIWDKGMDLELGLRLVNNSERIKVFTNTLYAEPKSIFLVFNDLTLGDLGFRFDREL